VLDDLSGVIQSEYVDPRPVPIIGPVLKAVEDDESIIRQHAPELHALAGIRAAIARGAYDTRERLESLPCLK
jgi:hypothetical protein